jgi:hypothetical protein
MGLEVAEMKPATSEKRESKKRINIRALNLCHSVHIHELN